MMGGFVSDLTSSLIVKCLVNHLVKYEWLYLDNNIGLFVDTTD